MEAACRNVQEEPSSEANLVHLLDLWSADWKHPGGALGPWGLGPMSGAQRWGFSGTAELSGCPMPRACGMHAQPFNGFLKSRFPSGTWTSIAVLFNPRMGLHRDIQNMPGHLNHGLALGDFTGRRVWIEDYEGIPRPGWPTKKGERELRGKWLDLHDKPVSFDARRYHMVEPHESSMWALAAYVPQAYARATEWHRQALREAGFPLPMRT
eukprot:s8716_g1.t1